MWKHTIRFGKVGWDEVADGEWNEGEERGFQLGYASARDNFPHVRSQERNRESGGNGLDGYVVVVEYPGRLRGASVPPRVGVDPVA